MSLDINDSEPLLCRFIANKGRNFIKKTKIRRVKSEVTRDCSYFNQGDDGAFEENKLFPRVNFKLT